MTPGEGVLRERREEKARARETVRDQRSARRRERRARARTYLHDRSARVRTRVGHVLGPVASRSRAKLLLPKEETASEDAAVAVREFQTELRTERKDVLEPLLLRLLDMGHALRHGKDVPPPLLEEGLDIWQMYVDRLYLVHLGQFAAARSSLPHTEACMLPMAEIEQEPMRADHRIGEVRTMLTGYASRPTLYRPWLGLALYGDATAELSWEGYEEDFADTCLPDHLTPSAVRQWTRALVETRDAAEATRVRVVEFLRKSSEFARLNTTLPRVLIRAPTGARSSGGRGIPSATVPS